MNKCQIKKDHSSTRVLLAASTILFRNLCWLCQILSGRDGSASKIRRRPIKHTRITLPILAALPLAQMNWLFDKLISKLVIGLARTNYFLFTFCLILKLIFYHPITQYNNSFYTFKCMI